MNIKNDDGNTALILASDKGHVEVVRALLDRVQIDVNIQN